METLQDCCKIDHKYDCFVQLYQAVAFLIKRPVGILNKLLGKVRKIRLYC